MTAEIKSPVLRLLIYGHVWLSLGAAAQVWWMCEVLVTHPWVPMLFAATATFSGYGWMRLVRMNVPELAGSPQMAWSRAHKKALLVAVLLTGLAAVIALYELLPRFHPLFWIACGCAALYVLPGFRGAKEVVGLRRIPLLKSFVIAFAWAAMTVLVAKAGEWYTPKGLLVIALLLTQFCFFLAIAIVFDIRDTAFDLPAIRSIPQLIGERWTRRMAVLLMVLPISMWMWSALIRFAIDAQGYSVHGPDPVTWTFALVAVGYVAAAIVLGRNSQGGPVFHGLVLDGLLILIPLLAWLGGLLGSGGYF